MRDTGPVARGTATNSGPLSPIDEAQPAIVDDLDIVREDVFEESEEAREIPHTAPKRGKQPTGREIEEHNRTHIPFRSWCKFCVSARRPTFLTELGIPIKVPSRTRLQRTIVFSGMSVADQASQCWWAAIEEQGCSLPMRSLTKELELNGWRSRWLVTSVSAAIMEE